MTLTKFMARSTWVAYAFEWGKTVKISFEGNWQMDRIWIILQLTFASSSRVCTADHIIDLQRRLFHDVAYYCNKYHRMCHNMENKAVSQQNLSYEQYYLYSYSKTKTLVNCTAVTS